MMLGAAHAAPPDTFFLTNGAAYSPKKIANLFQWFDAQNSASLTLSGSNVTQWNDISGNSRHLTASADPTFSANGYQTGFPAVQFSGSNQFLTRTGAIGGPYTAFTLAFVLNLNQGSNANFNTLVWAPTTAFSTCATHDIYPEMAGDQGMNFWECGIGHFADTAGTDLLLSQPLRVTITYDVAASKTGKFFVNNTQKGSAASSGNGTIGDHIQIGSARTAATTEDWKGSIGEMAFYSRALNSTELLNLDDYFFRRWYPNQLFDANSIIFSSASQQYDSGDNTTYNWNHNSVFTMCAWVKATGSGLDSILEREANDGSKYNGWDWVIKADNNLYFYLASDFTGNKYLYTKTSGWQGRNNWGLDCVTYDGSGNAAGAKLYTNGVLNSMTVQNDTLASNDSTTTGLPFLNGKNIANSDDYFDGQEDEISIWNVALSATEVNEVYHWGRPGNLANHSQAAHLTSWWRMGDGADTLSTMVDVQGTMNLAGHNSPLFTADTPR